MTIAECVAQFTKAMLSDGVTKDTPCVLSSKGEWFNAFSIEVKDITTRREGEQITKEKFIVIG